MLICNYSYINQICGHNHSGITNPLWIISPQSMRGYYGKAQVDSNIEQIKRGGFPTGSEPPAAFILGDKGALLSSTTTINSDSDILFNLSKGINITSSLEGSGTITDAQLSLIVQLAASLSGSGTISVASLVGVVSLSSSLSGTGSLSAGLNVIAFMQSALAGTSSVSADTKGVLSMSAAIYVNQSEATVREIVDGLWNAVAADYNTAGTMGSKMNSAASAGDPWSTTVPAAYPVGTAGWILGTYLDAPVSSAGSAVTHKQIADAVWNQIKYGYMNEETFGKMMQEILNNTTK